jgi:Leucine-rich repeat (LRR) protein
MRELNHFNISNNQLKDIPDSIVEMENLKTLQIIGNNPDNIEKFNEIEMKLNPDFNLKMMKKKNRFDKVKLSQTIIENVRYSSKADTLLDEFLQKEVEYKNELELIMNYYYNPLKKEINKLISKKDFDSIFRNELISIIQFNSKFFTMEFGSLRGFVEEFQRNIVFLNFYISYLEEYESSIAHIKFCVKKNLAMQNWYVMSAQNAKKKLPELLELPSKVLPRYLNFFNSLLETVTSEHETFRSINQIVELVTTKLEIQVDSIKQGKRKTLGMELIQLYSDVRM